MSTNSSFDPNQAPSPYFLLPRPQLLDDLSTYVAPPRSIKQIYGKIENMTETKQASFFLHLMAASNMRPDFAAAANAFGLDNDKAVKQRFKSLCEMNSFAYDEETNIIAVADDGIALGEPPSDGFPKDGAEGRAEGRLGSKSGSKASSATKRKAATEGKAEDDSEATPTKKAKKGKGKGKDKKAASKASKE